MLNMANGRYPKASFCIILRADDEAILLSAYSYWQAGYLYRERVRAGCNPQVMLKIDAAAELEKVIVPHFERYPLRAKKARDFEIWKLGVHLIWSVVPRERKMILKPEGGRPKGTLPKWTDAERAEFARLAQLIRTQRKFSPVLGSLPGDDKAPER